jgi:hypothetical protein
VLSVVLDSVNTMIDWKCLVNFPTSLLSLPTRPQVNIGLHNERFLYPEILTLCISPILRTKLSDIRQSFSSVYYLKAGSLHKKKEVARVQSSHVL